MGTPTGAEDRRAAALGWAAHLRQVRASILSALGSGELSLEGCFELHEDPAVAAIHVGRLLESVPGIRKVDARRALDSAGIAGDVSLGATPVRERAVVIEIANCLRT